MVGYHQTNQKTDTGKTLTRWPVLVDHNKLTRDESKEILISTFLTGIEESGSRRKLKPIATFIGASDESIRLH
jgi:hypothetical protein